MSWAGFEEKYSSRLNQLDGTSQLHSALNFTQTEEFSDENLQGMTAGILATYLRKLVDIDDINSVFRTMRARRDIDTPSKVEEILAEQFSQFVEFEQKTPKTMLSEHASYFELKGNLAATKGQDYLAISLYEKSMTMEDSGHRIFKALPLVVKTATDTAIINLFDLTRNYAFTIPDQILLGSAYMRKGWFQESKKILAAATTGGSISTVSTLENIEAPIELIEEGYKGFNILYHAGSYFAVEQSIGPVTVQDGKIVPLTPRVSGKNLVQFLKLFLIEPRTAVRKLKARYIAHGVLSNVLPGTAKTAAMINAPDLTLTRREIDKIAD